MPGCQDDIASLGSRIRIKHDKPSISHCFWEWAQPKNTKTCRFSLFFLWMTTVNLSCCIPAEPSRATVSIQASWQWVCWPRHHWGTRVRRSAEGDPFIFQSPMSVKVVATHIFLYVHPIFLGEMIQFDELIFSYGLVQPATTSRFVFQGLYKRPLFEESSVGLFGLLKF